MRRGTKITLVSAAAALALVPPASAAEPANQACLGEDFSSYTREGSPEGGLLSFAAGSGFGLTPRCMSLARP